MTKTKKTKKPSAAASAAGAALAEFSKRARMRNLTPAERSEQGRKAVAARRDRQGQRP